MHSCSWIKYTPNAAGDNSEISLLSLGDTAAFLNAKKSAIAAITIVGEV